MACNKVILVDPEDRQIGEIEKLLAHKFAMLHRAFSIFIFRFRQGKKELLLQRRALDKYHSGGLWTNTCCSHPRAGQELITSSQERLKEEMGIDVPLKVVGKFHYVALLDQGLVENEMDHVLVGIFDGEEVPFNQKEVEACRWIEIEALKEDLSKHPEKYTQWFEKSLKIALQ